MTRLPYKHNKYHNEPVVIDGHRFPSKKEANRYKELLLLQRAGVIYDLKLQVPFELQPSFKHPITGKTIRAINYIADFTYVDTKTSQYHIEDTKGFRTKEYEMKKKMMEYRGYTIEEI